MSTPENIGTSESGSENRGRAAERARESYQQAKQAAKEAYQQVRGRAGEYLEHGRAKAEDYSRQLEDAVRSQPMRSVLIAAGVGLLAGLLLLRRR